MVRPVLGVACSRNMSRDPTSNLSRARQLEKHNLLQSAFGSAGRPTTAAPPSQRHKSLITWHLPDGVECLVSGLDDWQTLQKFLLILQWITLFDVLRPTETERLVIRILIRGSPS